MNVLDNLEDTRLVKIEAKESPVVKKKRTRKMSKRALDALQKARDIKNMKVPAKRKRRESTNRYMSRVRKQYTRDLEDGKDMSRYENVFVEVGDLSNTPASDMTAADKNKENRVEIKHEQLLKDREEMKSYGNGLTEQAIAPIDGKDSRDDLIADMRADMEKMNSQIQSFNREGRADSQGIVFL